MTPLWTRLTDKSRLILIAGPCVIESEELCLNIARTLKPICRELGITYVFKASYDKANRTSAESFRGIGFREGLGVLGMLRVQLRVPTLTDVHDISQIEPIINFEKGWEFMGLDILQIPALLCRQTDLIQAAARTGKILNIKKGQFMAPQEMRQVVLKAEAFGANQIMVTERGTTFGYNNLVTDMRSIPIMQSFADVVIFDATHSVQLPGAEGNRSGGQRAFAPVLACAAVAAGANGVFIETHPDPDNALSDGPNMIPLGEMKRLLEKLVAIHRVVNL